MLKKLFNSEPSTDNQHEAELREAQQILTAISSTQAQVEFKTDGTIVSANQNFLSLMGYTLEEVVGKHHAMFAEPEYAASAQYREFWERLNNGVVSDGEFKRIGKHNREVWIVGSYFPIKNEDGVVTKVVKYARDITQRRIDAVEGNSEAQAVRKSLAVIEFQVDGTVITANQNFCDAVGYSLSEIQGKHHSMFVEPSHSSTAEYQQFWKKLALGEYDSGEYKRIAKSGKEIWINASYNPIFDLSGKVTKVIKFAYDVTEQMAEKVATEAVLKETSEVMGKIAGGDLTCRIMGDYGEKFQGLKDSVNFCAENLTEVVGKFVQGANSVTQGAQEIAQGNANLSTRTESQASSLEETASSMEQMTATVVQNSDNAQQANQLAVSARDQAEMGGSVVGNAVAAMGAINESSKQIADIIGVINEIAFQTNLLALNASVEAARAGEQGRGFAVVASEVRNLAGRSATAAKEIKELIEDSVNKVDEGTRLVDESGHTLKEIVNAVKKVTDIVGEIAAASKEQSTGIEQVNRAVMQMDEMTQQNTALVEEAAAASAAMGAEAGQLKELVSFFTVDERSSSQQATQSFQGDERRATSRPWSENTQPKETYTPRHSENESTGTDGDWAEF